MIYIALGTLCIYLQNLATLGEGLIQKGKALHLCVFIILIKIYDSMQRTAGDKSVLQFSDLEYPGGKYSPNSKIKTFDEKALFFET